MKTFWFTQSFDVWRTVTFVATCPWSLGLRQAKYWRNNNNNNNNNALDYVAQDWDSLSSASLTNCVTGSWSAWQSGTVWYCACVHVHVTVWRHGATHGRPLWTRRGRVYITERSGTCQLAEHGQRYHIFKHVIMSLDCGQHGCEV